MASFYQEFSFKKELASLASKDDGVAHEKFLNGCKFILGDIPVEDKDRAYRRVIYLYYQLIKSVWSDGYVASERAKKLEMEYNKSLEKQEEAKRLYKELLKEKNSLLCQIDYLKRERDMYKQVASQMDGYHRNQAEVKAGRRPAYKNDIDEKIIEMVGAGMNVAEISDKLKVTRVTVYNHIEKLRAAGIELNVKKY